MAETERNAQVGPILGAPRILVVDDVGADDYVEKPFSIGELLARLRAALRHGARDAGAAGDVVSLGLRVDLANRGVTKNGLAVKLTPKEHELLETRGHVVSAGFRQAAAGEDRGRSVGAAGHPHRSRSRLPLRQGVSRRPRGDQVKE